MTNISRIGTVTQNEREGFCRGEKPKPMPNGKTELEMGVTMFRGSYLAAAIIGSCGLLALAWLVSTSGRRGQGNNRAALSKTEDSTRSIAKLANPIEDQGRRAGSEAPTAELKQEGDTSRGDHVLLAQNELATQINESLDGFLYINHLLDQIQAFANLPVDPRVDLEYDDEDAVAFKILGTPEGTVAHFLVGRKSFERNDKEFRFLQMEIEMDKDKSSVFSRDSLRYGPRFHMTIDYDNEDVPGAMALILQRDIDLRESRKQGIDAYQGTYTTGAGYRVDFGDQGNCFSETFGLINGKVSHREKFGGIFPLVGDTKIDKERVQALFDVLMKNRLVVGGSLSEAK